jgi:DNA anti-recombination protein RmuC
VSSAPLLLGAVLGAVLAALLLLLRSALAGRSEARASDALLRAFGQLQAEVARLGRAQDETHVEVLRAREASVRHLGQAAEGLRGEIGQAHQALAEIRALERAGRSQLDRAADSLRRLELVVAGSGARGAAGENILGRSLSQIPPDLLERNAAFEGRVVEYALRLPGGRLLPIDSKWTGAGDLERLETAEDPGERRRLLDQVSRDVRLRARELTRYLDPERTLGLAVLAVPDAVHAASVDVHAEGWRDGILVVPYSLALPFVLSVYRLAVRFGAAPSAEEIVSALGRLAEALRILDGEVEGRLSRALVLAGNARDGLRGGLAEARLAAERLLREDGGQGPAEPPRASIDRPTAAG